MGGSVRLGLVLALVAYGCEEAPGPPEALAADAPRSPATTEDPSPAIPPAREPIAYEPVVLHDVSAPEIPSRAVEVFVPSIAPPDGGFPFLVVTDGALAPTAFEIHRSSRSLVEDGHIAPMVVILVPSHAERSRELADNVDTFVDFLADVVVPRASEHARLAETGGVMGYSFGGLVAVHAGIGRPDRFDRVIAMSPSLWFRGRRALRRAHQAPAVASRFGVDVGTREGDAGEVVPYMVADARQLRDDLIRRGLVLGRDLGYYEAPGRSHAMSEARFRIDDALRFVFGAPCEPESLRVHPFGDSLVPGASAAVAVEARCADGRPLTVPNGDVRFEVEGAAAGMAPDGVWRARRLGHAKLRARYAGLTADALLRVIPRRRRPR